MGAPIARNLARAGFDVCVWTRTREKAVWIQAADEGGVDLAFPEILRHRFEKAMELGHGDEDLAATYYACVDGD